jgi:hypothetical protein
VWICEKRRKGVEKYNKARPDKGGSAMCVEGDRGVDN